MLLDRLKPRRRSRDAHSIVRPPSTTADLVLEQARELCEVAGPWQVAADYHAMPEASLPEIAGTFAREAFPDGDFGVHAAACAGALAGFDRWLAAHPHEPYD